MALRQFLGQELYRDMATKADVLRLEDDTHSALAKLPKEAVVTEGLAGHHRALRVKATARQREWDWWVIGFCAGPAPV